MTDFQWMHTDHKPWVEKWVQRMWLVLFLGILGAMFWFIILSRQDLPGFDQLENPSNKQASQVFDYSGATIGRYFVENRVPVMYDSLSPHLISALVATEDTRFEHHSGIDFKALGRVLFKTVVLGQSSSGGGSTITQQLAKLLYSDRNFSNLGKFRRTLAIANIKFKEWITAVRLERSYTKEEILTMYLNHFNFINGAYGIRAASEIYFGKSQGELKLEDAATLVGMLKNPSLYNPFRRPEHTLQRRNVVLGQMRRYGNLKREAMDSLFQLPLGVSSSGKFSHDEGLAPYFRMELRKEVLRILDLPECRKPDGTRYDPFRDGLKIFTTIDTAVQVELEAAVMAHMPGLQAKFWRTWKNMDPWTYRSGELTTDMDLEMRQQVLDEQIRMMDRTQAVRAAELEPFIDEHNLKVGNLMLRDIDIRRMLREDAEKTYLKDLYTRKIISQTMVDDYRDIMKGVHWEGLKKTWKSYLVALKKMLDTPVPMVIFDYNSTGYQKDTLMSPLDSIRYHRMILQTGVVAIEPQTGNVRGWVGGVDYRFFQYDHVTSARQVGSTFKPFVYATAVALQSISPCLRLTDLAQTIIPGEGNFRLEKPWTPKNFDEYTGEEMTLFDGLRKSKNTFSVYLMKQLGDTEPVRGLIHVMGIDSSTRMANGQLRIPKQPSICLGSADLSVLEMTGAYATFANDGVYNKPRVITKIEDANGKLIYQELPLERRALGSEANYVMVEMLRYAARGSAGFAGVKTDFGGKTGTTNLHADGWYIGITPKLVIGVWVGGEDRWIRFTNSSDGQGSVLARPIFSEAIKRLENKPKWDEAKQVRFKQPSNISIVLDCAQYRREGGEEVPYDDDIYEDIFN